MSNFLEQNLEMYKKKLSNFWGEQKNFFANLELNFKIKYLQRKNGKGYQNLEQKFRK